ncbi:MAG: magnesium transporter [Nitrososphaeria archaeon]|nr:magnesium transporter [Nitrososphaeria archaeon]
MPTFFKTSIFRQSLTALFFDLGGLLSGSVAAYYYPMFGNLVWILLLFTPLLTVRGNIGGIFSGKLGTMLHLGLAKPSLFKNTPEFYSLIKAIFSLTFFDTLAIGAISFTLNYAFGLISLEHLPYFLLIPPFTCMLAILISIPAASIVGIEVFKRGLDPDIFIYPFMSTFDDILITFCYFTIVGFIIYFDNLFIMFLILALVMIYFSVIVFKNRRDNVFRRTILEGAPTVVLASLFGVFGGMGLGSLKKKIEDMPSILIIYPALIDALGDIGSILGSMETTKLALGYTTSLVKTFKETFADLVSVESAAAVIHVIFATIGFTISGLGSFSFLLYLISITLFSNIISFLFISIFSLTVATQTFKYGLDPDNFVIPLVASVSDVAATLSLVVSISIFYI